MISQQGPGNEENIHYIEYTPFETRVREVGIPILAVSECEQKEPIDYENDQWIWWVAAKLIESEKISRRKKSNMNPRHRGKTTKGRDKYRRERVNKRYMLESAEIDCVHPRDEQHYSFEIIQNTGKYHEINYYPIGTEKALEKLAVRLERRSGRRNPNSRRKDVVTDGKVSLYKRKEYRRKTANQGKLYSLLIDFGTWYVKWKSNGSGLSCRSQLEYVANKIVKIINQEPELMLKEKGNYNAVYSFATRQ